jgi:hypothetical protein
MSMPPGCDTVAAAAGRPSPERLTEIQQQQHDYIVTESLIPFSIR